MKNIMILSAGRRVELVKCFLDAIKAMNCDAKVIACDCSESAPALYFADEWYKLPRINDPRYVDSIIACAMKYNVGVIIPTIDTDLLILSKAKQLIYDRTGAIVSISDVSLIEMCRDKILTSRCLMEAGFDVPHVYTIEEIESSKLSFPLFIKPLDGSSSINAFKVSNKEELDFFRSYIKKPIIQEYIEGEEFTVDVFCDFSGKVITITPRLRISTRSGEVLKGQINKDDMIISSIKKLFTKFKFYGQITVQLKRQNDVLYYIEINPRFGGGAPMSIKAGSNSCIHILKLLNGEKLEFEDNAIDKLIFTRFDDSIAITESGKRII